MLPRRFRGAPATIRLLAFISRLELTDPRECSGSISEFRTVTGHSVSTAHGQTYALPRRRRFSQDRVAEFNHMDGASDLPEDFDQIAVVVDWLDACRRRDIEALLDLYAPDASFQCECSGAQLHQGRLPWKPIGVRGSATSIRRPIPGGNRARSPTAWSSTTWMLRARPVRVLFSFTADGKILRECAAWADAGRLRRQTVTKLRLDSCDSKRSPPFGFQFVR